MRGRAAAGVRGAATGAAGRPGDADRRGGDDEMSSLTLGILCAALLGGCTLIDVRTAEDPARLESDALINGLLSVGMPESGSLFVAQVFDGRSPGAFLSLELWPIARLEAGLVGATIGLGPIDLGLGIGPYRPVSRATHDIWDGDGCDDHAGAGEATGG